jgi:hypothetical protein
VVRGLQEATVNSTKASEFAEDMLNRWLWKHGTGGFKMTDREKLVDLLETHCTVIGEENCKAAKGEKCSPKDCANCLANHLIANGVIVRGIQKPIEMVELQENSVFWYEEKYEYELYPVHLEEGYVNFFVSFIGIEFAERHEKCNYGKTWRCWAEKPTEEERKAAEWES